jgi:hypothetical protein
MLTPSLPRELSYDNFGPHFYASLDEWRTGHPDVVPFMSFISPDHPTSSSDPFELRRLKVHERTIADLERFKESLDKLGSNLQSQASKYESTLPDCSFRYLDLPARKCLFIRSLILEIRDTVIAQKIWALMRRQNDVRSTIHLLSSDHIPSDRYCCLSASFLTMNFNVDEKQDTIQRLTAKLQVLKNAVDMAQQSKVWMTDFDSYFTEFIKVEEARIGDGRLVYVKSVDASLGLAVSVVFADQLKALRAEPKETLPECLFETCRRMIPEPRLTKRQFSIGLSVAFRVVYELLEMPTVSRSDPEELVKIRQIRELPARAFGLPELFVDSERQDVPIYDFFNKSCYQEAVDFLNMVDWSTNPFDRIYSVHRALEVIEACARQAVQLEEKSVKIMTFDDRFSIFLAGFLGSDIADIGQVVREARHMLHCFQLSSQFQYALETLSALVLFLSGSEVVDGVLRVS